jgi:CubicO group peptidase (beta-lactamase class C family)
MFPENRDLDAMPATRSNKKPRTYRPKGFVGVLVWIDPADKDALADLSARVGITQQDLWRRAIRKTLDRHARMQEGE